MKVFTICGDGSPARQQVLPTFANDEVSAEENIDDIIACWPEVSSYWIMRVSDQPIKLKKYRIEILVTHPTRTRTMSLIVNMEEPGEAKDIFEAFSEDWKYIKSFEILKVTLI
ncbi:hypothetical protein [Draconibacterium halophilum]|uniref:Uncharacterized protein n=1 Tax=Draconibacterium halophilum TaxID=2706887 RepID=A0A6C0RB84_9BACT|nr:hypothetical protein [Draconibacterium halophilum]QIA06431.1 hypothetical protein G0Q07_01215 [Draconibacterium halophilum]